MIKRITLKLGGIIAVLAMFTPIIIIKDYNTISLDRFIILLIISILYDVYMFKVIKDELYIADTKDFFDNVFAGKTIKSETEKDKLNWYKVICYNLFLDHFNNNKKKK
jgi:hypothetical protein